MNKLIKLIPFGVLIILLFQSNFPAVAQGSPSSEPDDGATLCPANEYFYSSYNCLPINQSESTFDNIWNSGISFEQKPLQAITPDSNLNYVPYLYYKITEYSSNYYSSLEAAIEKQNPIRPIGPGDLIYLTYTNVTETNRGTYFQTANGEWFPGAGTRVSVPVFQGLEFLSTPETAFGWILMETEVRNEPFYAYNKPAVKILQRNTLVQIYQTVKVEGIEWHLIGKNEWIEGRFVGVVQPNTTPPAGVTNNRWIDINLAEQTLAVYENNQLVFATMIASGLDPFWTQPGLFQIYQKKITEDMSGAFEADKSDFYYLENVPYTMYFDKARAIHAAYWRTFLGYPQSHGCINMSVGDAAWMFNWAQEGDWVFVHDPSGRTPTDPSYYGDGGA